MERWLDMDVEDLATPSSASASGADAHTSAATSATDKHIDVKEAPPEDDSEWLPMADEECALDMEWWHAMDVEAVAAPSSASASGADAHTDAATSATGKHIHVKKEQHEFIKNEFQHPEKPRPKVVLKSKARAKPKEEPMRLRKRPQPPMTPPPNMGLKSKALAQPQDDEPVLKKCPRPPSTPPPQVFGTRTAPIGSRRAARCTGSKHDAEQLYVPGSARNHQATKVRDTTTRSDYADADTMSARDPVRENQKSMAVSSALGAEKRDTYRALAAAQRLAAKDAGNTSQDSHRLWLDKRYKKRNEKRWHHAAQS